MSNVRMPREWHRNYEKAYYSRPEVKAKRAENEKKRRNDPLQRPKALARWKVNRALASGKLKKKPCEKCGNVKAHAHHHDYSKPLEINWLCRPCHGAEHAKAEKGA